MNATIKNIFLNVPSSLVQIRWLPKISFLATTEVGEKQCMEREIEETKSVLTNGQLCLRTGGACKLPGSMSAWINVCRENENLRTHIQNNLVDCVLDKICIV